MKAPRSCRLLNLRHVVYQTKGLKFRLDESSVAGQAHEDTRVLVGQIIVSPGENGEPELLLKGGLASILSLAAGKKTPAHPQDERVLLTMVAGAGFEPATFRL